MQLKSSKQLKRKYSHATSHLALVISALVLGGCSSGGDSAAPAATTTPTTTTTTTAGVAGLKTVEQIDVVAADDSDAESRKLRSFSKLGRAFDSPATDFTTDEQHYHVWHPALEPIESVNSILCFIGQVKAQEFVNEGPFIALVDESKCEKGGGDSASTQGSQSSSSEDNLPSYVEVVADATRTSSSSPMEVKIWIPEMETGGSGDNAALIKAKVTVNEAPSDSKPFGDFRMAFDMSMDIDGTVRSIGGGDLASQVSGSQTGFTFYENEGGGDRSSTKSASLLGSADGTTGVAMTRLQRSGGMGGGEESGTFGLSFNEANVLGRKGETAADIQTDTGGACLSRTEFDEAVWRYNLYNKATGERVTLNSGFPFKYTAEGEERFGYVGYWGVWAEGGNGLTDGTEITKQTFGEGGAAATDTYTVTTTPGKLIKYTANKALLTELAGVQFHYWNEDAIEDEYDQWVVEYVGGAFKIVGGITWGDMGPPEITTLTPATITLGDGDSLHLWSQQLGGSVVFRGGDDDFVVYNTEEVLSSIPAELDGVDLVCYDRCTKSGLLSSDLTEWDGPYTSPFRDSMGGSPTPVTYRMSAATMTLSKIVSDTPTAVTYPTGTIEANSHQWGIRSGHLVPKSVADTLDSPHEIYNPDAVAVFYEWEIGSNNWNKVVQVKDSNGTVQTFDKPIEFGYIHATANDRDDSSTFNGQRFLLSYQGDGQLHGIPFEAKVKDEEGKERGEDEEIDEDRHHVRWYPQFNLKDGITLGGSNQYVVKAIDIEQMMQEGATGACDELGASFTTSSLSLPSAESSTHDGDISSIGAIPTLSEEDAIPKVVGGEVQVEDEE